MKGSEGSTQSRVATVKNYITPAGLQRLISERLGIQIPAGTTNWRSFVIPIRECLKRFEEGKLQTYGALFE